MEKIDNIIEKIADEIMPQYPDISWDDCREKVIEGIKAGAEWMVRQMKQEQPDNIVQTAKMFLDELSKIPYNNTPITEAQIIIKQLIVFFENPASYDPNAINQEQSEVDLEKEIRETCRSYRITDYHETELGKNDIRNIARHFYELGLNTRKEE